jgi:hypothetical protein
MANGRDQSLQNIVKRLPTDFEPWGDRSRDDEWGPDCSCGCRWFIPLEGELQHDWGVCRNPGSPRCGLLTFEHQGCREFDADDEAVCSGQSPDGPGETESSDRPVERALLKNIRHRVRELRELLESASDHWGFEDPIYRFYHQSFKVYDLQRQTHEIVSMLKALAPERALDPWFLEIIEQGTGKRFTPEHNAEWTRVTRPIVEAFFHARYFLEVAIRYSRLTSPPTTLPSGYAALLCLYGLR